MASITSSTQTAFDVPALVSQLMAVERRPVDALNAGIASNESRISSLGTLSSLVATFQSATRTLNDTLAKFTATPSTPGVLTAVAAAGAVPGAYSVEVSQLAQSQTLVAAGQSSASAAIGDGTPTTLSFDFGTISGGTLTGGVYSGASFTANGATPATLVIDSSNNTLEGIRDAINAAGIGISATLVNDGSGTPYRLALAATDSGAASSLRISASGGDGSLAALLGYDPAGVQNLTQTRAAQNANLTVNGIAVTSTGNTVSEAIQGVTLTLTGVTAAPATLTVARDVEAMKSAAATFVEAYNALASQLKSRTAFASDTTTAGTLAGDSVVRGFQDQLRDLFNTPATGGGFARLAEVGIAFQRDGSLALDSAAFESALSSDFDSVFTLFSSPSGYATRLLALTDATIGTGGTFDLRTQSLRDRIKSQNEEIDRQEIRLDAIQQRLTREFTNLNLLLSRLNSTSTFLSQQLLAQPDS